MNLSISLYISVCICKYLVEEVVNFQLFNHLILYIYFVLFADLGELKQQRWKNIDSFLYINFISFFFEWFGKLYHFFALFAHFSSIFIKFRMYFQTLFTYYYYYYYIHLLIFSFDQIRIQKLYFIAKETLSNLFTQDVRFLFWRLISCAMWHHHSPYLTIDQTKTHKYHISQNKEKWNEMP